MWTAKSSSGGFSVNLFWPAPAPEKEIVQSKKRRKRRRRRAKGSATTNKSNQHDSSVSSPVLPTNPLILSDAHHSDRADSPPAHSETVQTPKNSTLPKPESITPSHSNGSTCSPVVDLAECTAVSYEVRDGVHGVSFCQAVSKEANWTPVVAKRKKRRHYIRRKFPPDHHQNAISESDSDSGSDCDL